MEQIVNSIKGSNTIDPFRESLLKEENQGNEEIGEIEDIIYETSTNNKIPSNDSSSDENEQYTRLLDDQDDNNYLTFGEKIKRILSLCTCNLIDNTFAFL